MPQYYQETKNVKPLIMPVVQYPDGGFATDSTPIILSLEAAAEPARTIFSRDPVLNFLSFLIEDFADEWLTKCLFHYRFSYAADRAYGPRWVMDDSHPQASTAEIDSLTTAFLQRQTERMPIVGCTPENAPVIEQTFRDLLEILEPFVALEKFLFGTRPSLADFGLFGQLKTLATDPTPHHMIRTTSLRVENWTRRLDDLSGIEGGFIERNELAPEVGDLAKMVAEVYLPYLRANYDAYNCAKDSFSIEIRKTPYSQNIFKYQIKCFEFLQQKYDALENEERAYLKTLTGISFDPFFETD